MAKGKSIGAEIHDAELLAQIDAEIEERGITKSDLVREALEEHTWSGSITKNLRAKRDALTRQLEAAREIIETQSGDIKSLNSEIEDHLLEIDKLFNQVEDAEARNTEIAEQRDAAISERDAVKKTLTTTADTHEQLLAAVRDAQVGGLLKRGSKVKQINLASFRLQVNADGDETAADTKKGEQ